MLFFRNLTAQILEQVDLNLLHLKQALPLMGHLMVHFLVQLTQFDFGLEVDDIVVLRTLTVLCLLAGAGSS